MFKRFSLTLCLMGALIVGTMLSVSAEAAWYTVDGIVGGQVQFDPETGTITAAEETIVAANVPETIDGVKVTTLGELAFEDCTALVSVTLPETVTSMGVHGTISVVHGPFAGCSSLVKVNLPDSLTDIGNAAFFECSNLALIEIPDSVMIMGDDVFWRCSSLTSITIPDSLTVLGDDTFQDCTSLVKVNLPDSLITMGAGTFCGCNSLTDITLPDSILSLGNATFSQCAQLENVTLPSQLTVIPDRTFYRCYKLVGCEIPESVLTIGEDAFCRCDAMTAVYLPKNLISIGGDAFSTRGALTDVYYGGSVSDWGNVSANYDQNEDLAEATVHYNSEGMSLTAGIPNGVQYVPFDTKLPGVSNVLTIASGNLPKGLGLFKDGTIRGIPMETGTFEFTLDLTAGETPYTIVIEAGTALNVSQNNDCEINTLLPTLVNNTDSQVVVFDWPHGGLQGLYLNGSKLLPDVDYTVDTDYSAVARITLSARSIANMAPGVYTLSATFQSGEGPVAQASQQVIKAAAQEVDPLPYGDVDQSAWYYGAVTLVHHREIIAGTTDGTYAPLEQLTRGMMMDALYRLAGSPAVTPATFTDVAADAWYAPAVSWAAEVGISNGVGNGAFAPETPVTREQMATMIQRYCDLTGTVLPLTTSATPVDGDKISSWAADSATAMYQRGALNGDATGAFNPAGTATRAEAASLFGNLINILDRT